ALLALDAARIMRIDPATGAQMWSTSASEHLNEYAAVFHGPRVEIPCGPDSTSLCAFALDDGRALGKTPDYVAAVASGPLFVLTKTAIEARGDDDHVLWSTPLPAGFTGSTIAASERFVIALARAGPAPTPDYALVVLAASDGHLVWERRNATGQYLGYIAAG